MMFDENPLMKTLILHVS